MDPQDLAMKFHAILQLTKLMGDEYKEMYQHQYNKDVNSKLAFINGFTSFESDSTDYVLEHCSNSPTITLVLFYDSQIYLPSIMQVLANTILDGFYFKFQAQFDNEEYEDMTPKDQNFNQICFDHKHQNFDFSIDPSLSFESSIPQFLETALNEYIKHLYVKLNTCNFQVPWIYIIQNRELCGKENNWVDPDFDEQWKAKQIQKKEREEEERKTKKEKQKKDAYKSKKSNSQIMN